MNDKSLREKLQKIIEQLGETISTHQLNMQLSPELTTQLAIEAEFKAQAAILHLISEDRERVEREQREEIASGVSALADKYNIPSIVTWQQGRFIDSPRYSHMSEEWKTENKRRESSLVRPGGGTNNALFQVSDFSDDSLIVDYLQELGQYIVALTNKLKQDESKQ